MGGVIIGHEMGRALGKPAMFVERPQGVFELRRGFHLDPGTKVLMVEDVVTTGLSSREAIEAVDGAGGEVIAEAALVDRSCGKADLGVPFFPLIRIDVPTYEADAVPPELAAIPAVKPGSRAASVTAHRCASASTSITSRPSGTRAAATIPIRCAPPTSPRRPAPTESPPTSAKTAATSPTATSTG